MCCRSIGFPEVCRQSDRKMSLGFAPNGENINLTSLGEKLESPFCCSYVSQTFCY